MYFLYALYQRLSNAFPQAESTNAGCYFPEVKKSLFRTKRK